MLTDETLAALRENAERLDNLFVYLDDFSFGDEGEDDDVSLLQALRQNTRVCSVDCDMHLEELGRSVQNFMTGVGSLQNLQRLRCSSSGDYCVTMAALAFALRANQEGRGRRRRRHQREKTSVDITQGETKLKTLELSNFLLQDASSSSGGGAAVKDSITIQAHVSYGDFVKALRDHPTLTNFSLGFGFSSSSSSSLAHPTSDQFPIDGAVCADGDGDDEAHYTLTPLINAIMSLPKLEWVRLDGAGYASRMALTPFGLSNLCRKTRRLTSVEIQDFDLSPGHIEAVASALGSNANLKVLSLSCDEFYYSNDQDSRRHQASISLLAQALRTNRDLEKLYIPMKALQIKSPPKPCKVSDTKDDALIEVFRSLEANRTLKKLHITGKPPSITTGTATETTSTALHEAFRHMLQHNYGLETIQIAGLSTSQWEAEIQLHCTLNSMGRGQLVRNTNSTTRLQWIDVLSNSSNDVSCLFHLLLLNPLLCAGANNVPMELGGNRDIGKSYT